MNKNLLIKILFLIVLGALIYTGCTKSDSDSDYGPRTEGYGGTSDLTTAYCLMCHKGNYQDFADSTVTLGEDNWLNPHRSAHGTNFPCRTCHEEDKTARQDTRCSDKTVMIADACSKTCHIQYTLTNPY